MGVFLQCISNVAYVWDVGNCTNYMAKIGHKLDCGSYICCSFCYCLGSRCIQASREIIDMVSHLYSLMDLVWQKVQKKATIMPAPERGVSSRLRSNIGARVGNVGKKARQHVS